MVSNQGNVIWGAGQGNHYPNTPFLNPNTGMPPPPWITVEGKPYKVPYYNV
jgi:hypothetical protein